MSSEPDKFPAMPGRLPTYRPPEGEFHALRTEDLAAQAAKAQQQGDGEGLPIGSGGA